LLESRDLPTVGVFQPGYVLPSGGVATPFGTPGPTGTTPTQIKQAYGFNQVAADGSGTTIAIVDAFDDPTIASDLQGFDAAFNLPNPTFTKMNETGGSTLPAANRGWATEIALDVEWAHAIAPGANILLVEANSASFNDLLTAVQTAAAQPGVVAVSMSWGGGEFSSETSFDSVFQTPANHTGVTFIASSGDSGAPASYPSASPNVLSVGGTTLNVDSSGNYLSESAWSGSGGGLSAVESQPAFQQGVVTQSSTQRATPDVAYDADPNTGFPVYDSFNNGTAAPWEQVGGTSDAAPQWAGLIALADQERMANGLTPLDGPSQTLPMLYSLASTDFHDITTGSSRGSPSESAGSGYDLATGLGTPFANLLIADLAGQSNSNPGATHFSMTAVPSSTAGNAFTVTVTALDSSGNVVSTDNDALNFTSTDSQAALPTSATLTNGVGTFTVTLFSAGNQTITVKDASNSAIGGSASVAVSAAAASQLTFGQLPTNSTAGGVITPAVTVRVLDQYGNLVSSDNTDVVTLAINNNPGGGTLSGTTSAIVVGGVATFNNLSINNAGVGYTLTASSGSLTAATSASFNVNAAAPTTVIEGFETSDSWFFVGSVRAARSTAAAHDGTYGLVMGNSNGWIYNNASNVQVQAGDTLSVWVQFAGAANGRAYFGFGASSSGTLSIVAAPNTGQMILQLNPGYGYMDLAAVNQGYQANHWYRLEVDWGVSGKIVGKLFDSNGTTLLNTVTATTTAITSGGIAFRAIGSNKYFDTVTDAHGVNSFAVLATPAVSVGASASLAGLPLGSEPFSGAEESQGIGQVTHGSSAGKYTASAATIFGPSLDGGMDRGEDVIASASGAARLYLQWGASSAPGEDAGLFAFDATDASEF
jgi:subtilase family serine protease